MQSLVGPILPHRVIVVTTHEDRSSGVLPGDGASTLDGVHRATSHAIRVAAKIDAQKVGVPPLSSGVLGRPPGEVAATMLPAIEAVLRTIPAKDRPSAVAFLCRDDRARKAIDGATDSPDTLSVRGALLLRAALAAARQEDRHTANELLSEATNTAQRLGHDSNAASTAFGPTNVVLHRVAAAVHLGDAGTAVYLAGTIDLDLVPLPERRAMLHLDVAAAYTQLGKHDRALDAVRTAEHAAPEEVRTRPAAHRILHDLLQASPPYLQRHVRRYADAVGALA